MFSFADDDVKSRFFFHPMSSSFVLKHFSLMQRTSPGPHSIPYNFLDLMWQRHQLGVCSRLVSGQPELYTPKSISSLGHVVGMPGESEKVTELYITESFL